MLATTEFEFNRININKYGEIFFDVDGSYTDMSGFIIARLLGELGLIEYIDEDNHADGSEYDGKYRRIRLTAEVVEERETFESGKM